MAKAIVGLGNPGPEYQRSRHNAGATLADHLVARWRLGPFRRGEQAVVATGRWNDTALRVLKPQTFMNASGDALRALRSPGFDPAADLLVLVDDIAFDPGEFRLRGAGSPGGHNGLRSIEAVLHRQDYARLRIGIGAKPPEYGDLADWVLGRMTPVERDAFDQAADTMAEAVECWISEGIERAMNRFNRPGRDP
ncbi:MAG: aminoacyl-tRNA hydrolase [Gemmatimonadales bacterium]